MRAAAAAAAAAAAIAAEVTEAKAAAAPEAPAHALDERRRHAGERFDRGAVCRRVGVEVYGTLAKGEKPERESLCE